MSSTRLEYLFRRYLDKTATESEETEFLELAERPENKTVLQSLIGPFVEGVQPLENPSASAEEAMLQAIFEVRPPARIVPMKGKFRWWRQVAAAVVILVLGGAAWFVLRQSKVDETKMADLPREQRFRNDIVPARQQVTITLADGSTTVLDSASNGTIARQGETNVVKQHGTLSYINEKGAQVVYNTVSTGKGSVINLKLADGTQVWLDAQSSIYFPTAFTGNERVVEIKGQAYFEVASLPLTPSGGGGTKGISQTRHARMPFKVKVGDRTIEVLGTHFNVNAHHGFTTTLLEGKVKVVNRQSSIVNEAVILQPGEQAIASAHSPLTIHHSPDLDEVMSWKNGRFQFNETSVEEIMDQLSRWYDIEVVYKDKINKAFVARISRNMPVSRLLGLLEMTKQVRFAIEGKKIIVMKW